MIPKKSGVMQTVNENFCVDTVVKKNAGNYVLSFAMYLCGKLFSRAGIEQRCLVPKSAVPRNAQQY